jgi:OmpA-OmpF porin, OOP family
VGNCFYKQAMMQNLWHLFFSPKCFSTIKNGFVSKLYKNLHTMKPHLLKLILIFGLLVGNNVLVEAQFNIDLKKKIKKQADNRANRKADKAVDKSFDNLEEGAGSLFKSEKKKDEKGEEEAESKNSGENKQNENQQVEAREQEAQEQGNPQGKKASPTVKWSKFDFVPGDEVVFMDDLLDEENGEFPSRWDLKSGQVEIAEVDGENVIMFIDGMPTIVPYLKNANEDYLPEVFTIEFDFYRPAKGNRIFLEFYDKKQQKRNDNQEITIGHNYISIGNIKGTYPKNISREEGRWVHIAIAFTRGKLKMYMDDTRLVNIPHYEADPSGFTINCYFADAEHLFFLKNFRIAKGGVKYYDRVLSDGKIIVNGIQFDVNKATLKPESAGPIRKIFKLMQKKPELNFSIEGHTDSDGDAGLNQTLSENRANLVMIALQELGIDASRMKTKGFGESKPIGNNASAEGKANNRRVEFVKF